MLSKTKLTKMSRLLELNLALINVFELNFKGNKKVDNKYFV